MRNYYRIMLGPKSIYAEQAKAGNFIGADFFADTDFTGQIPDDWRAFNKMFIPVWLERNPGKSKVAAGLACGMLWTIIKGIKKSDIVLSPNGQGSYLIGEVLDDYSYHRDQALPHRRTVSWFTKTLDRAEMSEALRNSTGSIGTLSTITKYATELEAFLTGIQAPVMVSSDSTIENPSEFALEKHLEDFLVQNWHQTELGKAYDIFEEDGELVGKQYPSDTGPMDILAISKDKKSLLVVELKKGRVSDSVVGQIQRYMGYVLEELAEEGQTVKGVIIGQENDIRIKRALAVTNNIEFYKYQITFKLLKG